LQSVSGYRDADLTGKGRGDPANSFPEHKHIAQVQENIGKREYTKDAKKDMAEVAGIPVDAPDFVRAKDAQVIRSDLEYKKEMPEVTAMYKGYQTMDAASHPVVTKGKKAAEIVSDRLYHEDYEDEKALVYYPVHITEGYDAVKKTKEATADANYKTGIEDNKKGNSFKPTDTETYSVMKTHEATKDRIYKGDYEATKHQNKPLAVTNEMILSKKLVEDTHDKWYQADAKFDLRETRIDAGAASITHAKATQPLQSVTGYRDADLTGSGRGDPANSFPEHKHIAQVQENIGQREYTKDAKRDMAEVAGLPADIPDIVRSKHASAIRSDLEYKKEMPAVTDQYKGYQTMDAATHPVITKGNKIKEILSDRLYHEDYEDEKALIYYPVHITEGYDSVKKTREATSDAVYKAGLEDAKKGNSFKPTDTETYATMKKHEATKDRIYKGDYEATKHQNKPLAVNNEMKLAKKLVAETHDKFYQADAKFDQQSNMVGPDAVSITHAKATQPLQSQSGYKDPDLTGSGRGDPANSFPEHKHIAKVQENIGQREYTKDAKRDMAEVAGLPADIPDIVRSKHASAIRSDLEYKKEMPSVTDQYKGYQTMDAATHPVITKGNKIKEILSDRKYHEDYEDEKALIYYPVHITEGYDSVKKTREATSDAVYKAGLEDAKKGNAFKPTDTETYATMKKHEATKDRIYKGDYEATKHQNKPLAETNEMILSKKLVAETHDKWYQADAKFDLKSNQQDQGSVLIAHAKATQPLQSVTGYRDGDLTGQGRGDPANSFPEHKWHAQVAEQISKN
jgi:hypothetical protein